MQKKLAALQVKEFLHGYQDLMYYAITGDKLAPPSGEAPKRPALPRVGAAERVARGASAASPGADGGVIPALERALSEHADWLELSVAPNARRALVVRHWKDPSPAERAGRAVA